MKGAYNTMDQQDKKEILLRFVYLDGNSCISERYYLFSVPKELSVRDVKMEISRQHNQLKEAADYAESLDMMPIGSLTDEEQRLLDDAEANNPYFSVPPTADMLIKHVCQQNPDWSVSQAKGVFNLSSGTW